MSQNDDTSNADPAPEDMPDPVADLGPGLELPSSLSEADTSWGATPGAAGSGDPGVRKTSPEEAPGSGPHPDDSR